MINALNTVSDYDIEIGDKKLTDDQKLDIVEISFEEKMNATSCVRVIIRDSDEMSLAFDDLKFGTPVVFSLGWYGAKQTLFKGTIISPSPTFKANAPGQVEITAYDAGFGMKSPRNPALLHGTTWFQIVRDILERNKKEKLIDDYVISHPQKVLEKRKFTSEEAGFTAEDTDFGFLAKCATRTGYQTIVKYGGGQSVFYFVDPDYFTRYPQTFGVQLYGQFPMFNFYISPLDSDMADDRGLVIYTFEPELRSPGQRTEVKVVSWCSVNTTGTKYGTDQLSGMALGPKERNLTRIYLETSPIPILTIVGEVAQSDEAAGILAKAELERRARELVTGQVTMNGWVPLRAGQRHNFFLRTFKTFGQAFSGAYNITAVKHSFTAGQGFRTKFDVSRYVVNETTK
ncbi:hypothetical protein M0R72_07830 [Candidatus Pacearchaeota archaeon]|jgi:phage protein D|nr:hypothetical protein [Candidatus Pacearchaeota archaeon]